VGAESLAGGFGRAGLVVNPGGAGLGFDDHGLAPGAFDAVGRQRLSEIHRRYKRVGGGSRESGEVGCLACGHGFLGEGSAVDSYRTIIQ
jgi:hypothetical protein